MTTVLTLYVLSVEGTALIAVGERHLSGSVLLCWFVAADTLGNSSLVAEKPRRKQAKRLGEWRLGKAGSGGRQLSPPPKIWSWGQKLHMTRMKINLSCYVMKFIFLTLTLFLFSLKNVSRAAVVGVSGKTEGIFSSGKIGRLNFPAIICMYSTYFTSAVKNFRLAFVSFLCFGAKIFHWRVRQFVLAHAATSYSLSFSL